MKLVGETCRLVVVVVVMVGVAAQHPAKRLAAAAPLTSAVAGDPARRQCWAGGTAAGTEMRRVVRM